jgi:amidase
LLHLSAISQARLLRERQVSSVELITAHLNRIQEINPALNAVVALLGDSALEAARLADAHLSRGEPTGPLQGVPFSIKDSIDVAGARCTAGTLGRRNAPAATRDATLVRRLRTAGAIPIAKTNLPDLLFAFESDNLIFGRTNNPYDLARTSGGSSGGEAALIAACGSPLGLGSDCAGSVRLPAGFCGIAGIKPTSGRLPRTGHVPAAGGWIEALWQIGPMARFTEDLVLAMRLLAGPDGQDFTSSPVPLLDPVACADLRIAFFTDNGFAPCAPAVKDAVNRCAASLARSGLRVEERRPPNVEQAFDLEFALLGADGVDGIDAYLRDAGSTSRHPLLTAWLDRMRPLRASASQLGTIWSQWDSYRAEMARFFEDYDAILCPLYTQPALPHGESIHPGSSAGQSGNFEGFSYTMAWNVAGAPAATVRCAEASGLPINVQVVAAPWRDLTALAVCRMIEDEFGGWQAPAAGFSTLSSRAQTGTQPATAQ